MEKPKTLEQLRTESIGVAIVTPMLNCLMDTALSRTGGFHIQNSGLVYTPSAVMARKASRTPGISSA